jgi:hypothetical protein
MANLLETINELLDAGLEVKFKNDIGKKNLEVLVGSLYGINVTKYQYSIPKREVDEDYVCRALVKAAKEIRKVKEFAG